MDVALIFKVAGAGIIVAVLHQILMRSGREEQALMVTIAGIVVVMLMLINQIGSLFDTMRQVFDL